MILVTGASGFIGYWLVCKLCMEYQVLATDIIISPELKRCRNVKFVLGDICDYKFQIELFNRYDIDTVVHLAAEKNLVKCERNIFDVKKLNVDAALSLFELAQEKNAHFVFLSSDQVFDGKKGNYLECDERNPINQYGKFKADVEKVLESCSGVTICRTALVFGNIQLYRLPQLIKNSESDYLINQSEIVQHIVIRLAQNKEINLPGDEYISPTYVGLLVEQLYIVIQKKVNGILHCCGPERISRYDLGVRLATKGEFCKERILSKGGKDILRPKDVSMNVGNTQEKLGYLFPSLDNMLKKISF